MSSCGTGFHFGNIRNWSKNRRLTSRQFILYNSSNLIVSDKCYDGEEYIGSPKPREKMAGANLREGLMEVASEQ